MFELETGREHFFQWDTGQRLIIKDTTIIEAHFCNRTDDCALVCEAYTDGGKRVVDVPNILLQNDWPIRVYAYCGSYTKVEKRFEVVKRSKPADYIYTETEVKRWEDLANRAETALNEVETLAADVGSAEEARQEAETERQAAAVAMAAATEEAKTAAAEAQTALETLISNAHADAIVAEKTATIVNVDDAAATLAVGATSQIVAKQAGEGDATPDNIRAITGWNTANLYRTGKNLCELGTVEFKQYKEYILNNPIPAGTYTFTATVSSTDTDKSYCVAHFMTGTKATTKLIVARSRQPYTVVFAEDINAIRFYASDIYVNGAGDTATFANIQIEAGTVATKYEPYLGASLSAELPETVYGGSIDWDTGVLTITHQAQILDGSEDWTKIANGAYQLHDTSTFHAKTATLNNSVKHICSHFIASPYKTSPSDNTCYELNNNKLIIKCDMAATVDDFKSYLAEQANAGTPVIIVWEMMSKYHTTHQLTPQQIEMLKGLNNVWSDCGETTLAYIADTKLYIDKKFNELQNAIVSLGSNV